jgi:endonuclease YncB( thermonuclease family)
MTNTRKIPFVIKPAIAFIVVLSTSPQYLSHAQIYLAKRVIDGDTIQLNNGVQVKLISVDTPETKYPNKPVESFCKIGMIRNRET